MPFQKTILALLVLVLLVTACQTTTQPSPAPKTDDRVPVTISSNPGGAEIYLDGSLVGSTTMSFRLLPGKHRIEVRLDGFQTWVRELEVRAEQPTRIEAHLKRQ